MDIKHEKLKIQCPNCGKEIIITFNTIHCPKCNQNFDSDSIHQVFYDYETQVANSSYTKAGEKLEKFSKGAEKTGKAIEQIGCFIFMLPLGLICIWFIIKMLF